MEKAPEKITLATLEVVIMPNGEIISRGKTIGWFEEYAKYLRVCQNEAQHTSAGGAIQ